jgi:hypothetical protein
LQYDTEKEPEELQEPGADDSEYGIDVKDNDDSDDYEVDDVDIVTKLTMLTMNRSTHLTIPR